MKNKIGWCNTTWNPVWGCKNHCEYCYARAIAKRFWKRMWMIEANHQWKEHPNWAWTGDHLEGLKDFKPTFLNAQFEKKLPKKPQRIFVGSMSEIAYWEKEWIERVLNKIREYPQHIFQFLTQDSDIYFGKYDFPINCWLGTTITRTPQKGCIKYTTEKAFNLNKNNLLFISFEPLLERIKPNFKVDWVIIGAETGNRKNKVIPNLDWVLEIVRYCEHHKIPVYIKDNLVRYYHDCIGYKQFPGDKLI